MSNLLTVAKAAEMARVSKNTLYKQLNNGKLSYTNDESGKLIDISELLRVYPLVKDPEEHIGQAAKDIEIKYLKEKIQDLNVQLAESRERERRVMDMLAIKVKDDEPRKQGFISRFLGQ